MPSVHDKASAKQTNEDDDEAEYFDDDDDVEEGSVITEQEDGATAGSNADTSDGNRKSSSSPLVMLTGCNKKTPVIVFKADATVAKNPLNKSIGEKYHLAFKMGKSECKIVRTVLTSHGFHEVHVNSSDFNLMWTGGHVKPFVLRTLLDFQKVNHFPRSYEVTRKDRLFKNIQRMQQAKGAKHFDLVPQSFLIPSEFSDFSAAIAREKCPWIVKPIASSRGRGIFLVTSPDQVPLDEPMIACRYIANPLLIDGFKFDVRLYVAVTSFDPLLIYLYEEGLTRFATVRFDKSLRSIRNSCMHLTNYSVNKKSNGYVRNDDASVEDYGNKWSLGALLRYLKSHNCDTTALMLSIEDVIIKVLISVELPIASACKMFQPHRGNCFELFGFDILIDDNLRPWVLEVNLSPSLACEAPLDLKVKTNMVSDLFSLVGVECKDPVTRKSGTESLLGSKGRAGMRAQTAYKQRSRTPLLYRRSRPSTAFYASKIRSAGTTQALNALGLTGEEMRILCRVKEEYLRRGGWVRIFPTPDTWDTYSGFLQFTTTYNHLLHRQLFNRREKSTIAATHLSPVTASASSQTVSALRNKTISLHSTPNSQLSVGLQTVNSTALHRARQRSKLYERKLCCLGDSSQQNTEHYDSADDDSCKQADDQSSCASQSSCNEDVEQDDLGGARMLDQSKQSTAALSAPNKHVKRINVVKLLESGRTLSKVQARFAFAMYLTCIQRRLTEESRNKAETNVDSCNEQMDLVLRFLQRAASNLHQPFKVTIPTSELPINSRRHILAKELRDFVEIYNKETELLRQRLNSDPLRHRPVDTTIGLDEEEFNYFVSTSSENELEEVLTVYTRLSKSASVFLRSCARPAAADVADPTAAIGSQRGQLLDRRGDIGNSRDSEETENKGTTLGKPHMSVTISHEETHIVPLHPVNRLSVTGGSSLLTAATAALYSAKQSSNLPLNTFSSKIPHQKNKLAQDVSEAVLQNLAARRKKRQYSSDSAGQVLRSSHVDNQLTIDSSALVDNENNSRGHDSHKHKNGRLSLDSNNGDSGDKSKSLAGGETDYLYEGTDIGGRGWCGGSEEGSKDSTSRRRYHSSSDKNYSSNGRNNGNTENNVANNNAENKINSANYVNTANNGYSGNNGNIVTEDNTAAYFQQQKTMIEKSRALVEESKVKHHLLVAQAHKHLRGVQQEDVWGEGRQAVGGQLVPRPPEIQKEASSERKQMGARSIRSAK